MCIILVDSNGANVHVSAIDLQTLFCFNSKPLLEWVVPSGVSNTWGGVPKVG